MACYTVVSVTYSSPHRDETCDIAFNIQREKHVRSEDWQTNGRHRVIRDRALPASCCTMARALVSNQRVNALQQQFDRLAYHAQ